MDADPGAMPSLPHDRNVHFRIVIAQQGQHLSGRAVAEEGALPARKDSGDLTCKRRRYGMSYEIHATMQLMQTPIRQPL